MFDRCAKKRLHRSKERLQHHYEVEKRIAGKLRHSTRAQRIEIMRTMYDELFREVPDHPRITIKSDPKLLELLIQHKLRLLGRYLQPSHTYLEFGPGGCHLAVAVCPMVKRVYGVDIADGVDPQLCRPNNFTLIVYDGYNLDLPSESIDVIFSDQMIEHLHPDDVEAHLQLAHRLLRQNGVYILRTPHGIYGPHDISRYFSNTPEGFHLKEWNFHDLGDLIKHVGFDEWQGFWYAHGICWRIPKWLLIRIERLIGSWPMAVRRNIGPYLLPGVTMVVRK